MGYMTPWGESRNMNWRKVLLPRYMPEWWYCTSIVLVCVVLFGVLVTVDTIEYLQPLNALRYTVVGSIGSMFDYSFGPMYDGDQFKVGYMTLPGVRL